MPIYMDVHEGLGDATPEELAAAHQRDLDVQDEYGARFLTYWLNDKDGQAFCLVEAPDTETMRACHRAAHGLMPDNIIEVGTEALGSYMGALHKDSADRALIAGTSEPDTGLRAIMFTDLQGSTEMSTRLGDDQALEAVRTHDSIVRSCLEATGGREVKHTGDGILASFTSITKAVDATIGIQREADSHAEVAIKVGISAGEPVTSENDIYGAAVNLAARLCEHAQGGQVLAAGTVRDLTIGKGLAFLDKGTMALKGFPEPVRVYEISTAGS